MTPIIRIAVIGIIGALLTLMLRQQKPEIAAAVAVATGLVILFLVLEQALSAVSDLLEMVNYFGVDTELVSAMLRIIGVAYIGEFAIQSCKDAGENAIASKVELGAKVIIFAMCAPMVWNLLSLLSGLLIQGG